MRRPNRANKPPGSAASKERVLKLQAPQGSVNFPCHEASLDEHQKQQLREMQLYPADGVDRYCRKIPFRGAKGQLFEITGRHEFNRKSPHSCFLFPFSFPSLPFPSLPVPFQGGEMVRHRPARNTHKSDGTSVLTHCRLCCTITNSLRVQFRGEKLHG